MKRWEPTTVRRALSRPLVARRTGCLVVGTNASGAADVLAARRGRPGATDDVRAC